MLLLQQNWWNWQQSWSETTSQSQTRGASGTGLAAAAHEADLLPTVTDQLRALVIWLHRYADMRFLGINTPEEYGGLGLGHLVSSRMPGVQRLLLLTSPAAT